MPPWALPFLDTAYVPASSMLGPLLQPRSLGPPPGGSSLVHISAHFPGPHFPQPGPDTTVPTQHYPSSSWPLSVFPTVHIPHGDLDGCEYTDPMT